MRKQRRFESSSALRSQKSGAEAFADFLDEASPAEPVRGRENDALVFFDSEFSVCPAPLREDVATPAAPTVAAASPRRAMWAAASVGMAIGVLIALTQWPGSMPASVAATSADVGLPPRAAIAPPVAPIRNTEPGPPAAELTIARTTDRTSRRETPRATDTRRAPAAPRQVASLLGRGPATARPAAATSGAGPSASETPVAAPTPAALVTPAVATPAIQSVNAATPVVPPAPAEQPSFTTPVPPAAPTNASVGAASTIDITLDRYARAFSALDASAVKAVWPDVDERALRRAFSGLESQKVAIQSCNVSLTSTTAVASCDGTVSHVPRVGRKTVRTDRREWTFYLRQDNQQWTIEGVQSR